MTAARIRRLRRLFGLTESQARLIATLHYGAAHD